MSTGAMGSRTLSERRMAVALGRHWFLLSHGLQINRRSVRSVMNSSALRGTGQNRFGIAKWALG